jgi:DNA segregation ATPase FtsK/SpoIIIE, S-DNA-T family
VADGTPSRRTNRRVFSGSEDQHPRALNRPPSQQQGPPNGLSHGFVSGQQGKSLSAEHTARIEAELAAKAEALAFKAKQIDEALGSASRDEIERSRSQLGHAKTLADDARSRTIANIRANTEKRRAEISGRLRTLLAEAAPGPFSAAFSQDWAAHEGASAGGYSLVRRGTTEAGTPALYPLYHDKGWFLDGPVGETIDEIHTSVLRAVAGLPLRHLRIDVYDPRIEGKLGGFAPLRAAHSAAFPPPTTSASAFRIALESVTQTAVANAEAIATEHVKTLGELWQVRGVPSGDYRFVVVLNYPEGIDREAQNSLVRLARSGGANGVNLLVQYDKSGEATDESVRVSDLAQHLRKSRLEKTGELLLSDYPKEIKVVPDGLAPASLVNSVINQAMKRATDDTGPVVPLQELIALDVQNPWQGDSTDGVDATIARVGKRNLSISLRSQNPPVSNVLIGGAVGQGKSNLLLDIIYALASRYSPDDLELHLLDFKRGLEFQRFAADQNGKNWLPHAKVISLESDRSFGVAVLLHILRELESRAKLFKKSNASGIEEYRRKTGQPLPRVLLVVDEFQVLMEGDDRLADKSVEMLETISRQGRASGVHLLLSSQTTTGVSGLRVKGDSIFSQFPLRISLKNTVNESEAILAQGNKAAADLVYRGEVIINRNFGHDPDGSNERAISAYADPSFVANLQRSLWELPHGKTPPLVFVSTEFATWPQAWRQHQEDGAALGLIGRPVQVTDEPVMLAVHEDVDQAVAIIGADETLTSAVLGALTYSLGTSLRPRRVIVIDLVAAASEAAGSGIGDVLRQLTAQGVAIERYGRQEAIAGLKDSVRATLQNEDETALVIGIGWQRWTGLDDPHPVDPEDENSFATFALRDVIEELIQRGALKRTYFVGWWTNLRSLQDQLGYSHRGVRHFITAKLGLEDYRSLTSHAEPGIQGYPRVGYIDRGVEGGPIVVVPFATQEKYS